MSNEKDLVIRMAQADQETVAAVNGIMAKHGLPGYLYEPILNKTHQKLINLAGQELASALAKEKTNADQ